MVCGSATGSCREKNRDIDEGGRYYTRRPGLDTARSRNTVIGETSPLALRSLLLSLSPALLPLVRAIAVVIPSFTRSGRYTPRYTPAVPSPTSGGNVSDLAGRLVPV